ncbi:hypothetical protein LCGC14_2761840, partial [marine sediment metagenome]
MDVSDAGEVVGGEVSGIAAEGLTRAGMGEGEA